MFRLASEGWASLTNVLADVNLLFVVITPIILYLDSTHFQFSGNLQMSQAISQQACLWPETYIWTYCNTQKRYKHY